jgi:hypothetical protein
MRHHQNTEGAGLSGRSTAPKPVTRTDALAATANLDPHRRPQSTRDWHLARTPEEPRCGADQWRTWDRQVVIYMHEISHFELDCCISRATNQPQHSSRLASLLDERLRRTTGAHRTPP